MKQSVKTLLLTLSLSLITHQALANPILDHLVSGDATIEQSGNTLTINQASERAIVDWKSFNIHENETTHFNQPENGITLNRIDPRSGASKIYGHLTSNGQVLLINPNGIFFGPSA